MNAGKLTERIEIFSPAITKNDVGEESTEYVFKYSTRAYIRQIKGSRDIDNMEVVYNYSRTFEIRIYVKVDEFDRIKWNDKFYRILNIDINKELQKITIEAEKIND